MSALDAVGRIALASVAVVLPAAPPVTIPWWSQRAVELFGTNVPIASTVLSMIGLFMARGISSAREGPAPGGKYLTGLLALIVFGLVVEADPKPGIAIAWGAGVGGSGIVIYDLLRTRIRAVIDAVLFGGKPKP